MKIKVLKKKSLTPEEPEYRKKLREIIHFLDKTRQIFLTGSERFMVETNVSDIDYVMMKEDYDNYIYPIIHGQDGIKEEDGSGLGHEDPTLHSSVRFEKYNFILVWDEQQFMAWRVATETVEKLGPESLCIKTRRVQLFSDIKMIIYNFLESRGKSDT